MVTSASYPKRGPGHKGGAGAGGSGHDRKWSFSQVAVSVRRHSGYADSSSMCFHKPDAVGARPYTSNPSNFRPNA